MSILTRRIWQPNIYKKKGNKQSDKAVLTSKPMKASALPQFTVTDTLTTAVIFAAQATYYLPRQLLAANQNTPGKVVQINANFCS